jgi:C1A family cysteine protease
LQYDGEELAKVRETIKQNLIYIDEHNAKYEQGLVDFFMGPNQFTHWTDEKFNNMLPIIREDSFLNRRKRAAPYSLGVAPVVPSCTTFQPYKSWTEEGKVQDAKDQRNCGDCYIFAANSVTESAVSIAYNVAPPSYSEQHILDCGVRGCQGGWHSDVWPLSKTFNGVVETSNFNAYTAIKSATCNNSVSVDSRAIVDYWEDFPRNNEANLPCYLNSNGPVFATLWAAKDFRYVAGGVYRNTDGTCANNSLNHAVVITGYGTTSTGIPYWILKNSWSKFWGKI